MHPKSRHLRGRQIASHLLALCERGCVQHHEETPPASFAAKICTLPCRSTDDNARQSRRIVVVTRWFLHITLHQDTVRAIITKIIVHSAKRAKSGIQDRFVGQRFNSICHVTITIYRFQRVCLRLLLEEIRIEKST